MHVPWGRPPPLFTLTTWYFPRCFHFYWSWQYRVTGARGAVIGRWGSEARSTNTGNSRGWWVLIPGCSFCPSPGFSLGSSIRGGMDRTSSCELPCSTQNWELMWNSGKAFVKGGEWLPPTKAPTPPERRQTLGKTPWLSLPPVLPWSTTQQSKS